MLFKAKGTLAAAAAALVVSTVMVAGFAAHVTSGAGTDIVPVSSATPTATAVAPTPTVAPANPPASQIEPPAAGTTNPNGGDLGVNNGPAGGAAGLPNAGSGPKQGTGMGLVPLLALLGFAGAMFAGAGATIAGKRRG